MLAAKSKFKGKRPKQSKESQEQSVTHQKASTTKKESFERRLDRTMAHEIRMEFVKHTKRHQKSYFQRLKAKKARPAHSRKKSDDDEDDHKSSESSSGDDDNRSSDALEKGLELEPDLDVDASDGLVERPSLKDEFGHLRDYVPFGAQAAQPPTFRQLPKLVFQKKQTVVKQQAGNRQSEKHARDDEEQERSDLRKDHRRKIRRIARLAKKRSAGEEFD